MITIPAKPTVSVIIPTRNRSSLLGRAIQSVLDQTYADYELIVVDDCSADNTDQVVRRFDRNIRYIQHANRKGGSAARNTGIGMAGGRYIAFLDDDDEWMPEKLQEQIYCMNMNPSAGLVYTKYITIEQSTESTAENVQCTSHQDLLKGNCIGPTSTYLIAKKCFDRIGMFDESLPSCQDWDLLLRLYKEYPLIMINIPLVKYHLHENRITTNSMAKILGREMLLDKHRHDMAVYPSILSRHLFEIGNMYCHAGVMTKGRYNILHSILAYPVNIQYLGYYIAALFGAEVFSRAAQLVRFFKERSCHTNYSVCW